MIANSVVKNEDIGAAPSQDTVPMPNENFVNDKPEQINLDKEANPKQDNAKDESPKNNAGYSKEDPNSSMSDTTGGKDIDENYFSVGHFLKKDGTSEEVRLHVSELALDSDEDSEEEDFDYLNPPHHFAEDGSVQKLDLRKKSPKKTPEISKVRTYSLGNFLKRDGTLEEITIPFDELESDSEEEDLLEGISNTYHLGIDGCLQPLFDGKSVEKDKVKDKIGNSSHDKNPLHDNVAPIEKNMSNHKEIINDKIITVNDKNSSVGKNPFYDDVESKNKNTSNDKFPSDDKNPFVDIDESNGSNPFDDNDEPNGSNPFDNNDELNDKNTLIPPKK